MKFGIRECCDVVFRAKAFQQIGNKKFYKGEPVIYFDTLKTSTLEGAATTVYAQGGKGNSRLMAWEGERTLTFTMEDALISPEGISILTGAGIIGASNANKIIVHATDEFAFSDSEKVNLTINNGVVEEDSTITLGASPAEGRGVYVMIKDSNGNIITEPFSSETESSGAGLLDVSDNVITFSADSTTIEELKDFDTTEATVLIDYYVEKTSGAYQIDITPDKFGGYFYVEGDTLFRDQATGVDMPAQIVIPNAKVQSNFTFAMSGSGDPSTFTFTLDAFPGRVIGSAKDVLATIQIIEEAEDGELDRKRPSTDAETDGDKGTTDSDTETTEGQS